MTTVVIAKNVQDETRCIYWTGVCPSTGLATWSYDRQSAVRMLAHRARHWLAALRAMDPSGAEVEAIEEVEA